MYGPCAITLAYVFFADWWLPPRAIQNGQGEHSGAAARPLPCPLYACAPVRRLTTMADISYGDDAAQIVARPIEPKQRKAAPLLTPEQRKKAAQERSDRQEAVEQRIAGWMDRTDAEAEDMAATFGKNKQHYLNLMFSGGPKLATSRKSNTYNAWLHHVAQTNDGTCLLTIQSRVLSSHG